MEEDGVGTDFPSDIQTRETADMFLVLIVKKLLKENGGRGAVVLPDGTLFGEGVKAKVKELLMRGVPPPHHHPAAQRRLQSLHRHQDQPAVLHQGQAHRQHLVLRAPVSRGREKLLQDQAAPHRRATAHRRLVGPRGRRLQRPCGDRAGLEGRFQAAQRGCHRQGPAPLGQGRSPAKRGQRPQRTGQGTARLHPG